ncbi:DoxX family protein [Corynebacterium mastitidis]|uniref:DoxX family protein n=1 Tax=Corynebacterium mastitidis TaxID=161890 RepID=UPI00254CD43C|nr:DoxX family protein [Corynebacterium mastitidis]MDK8451443.1 DoxX family protein [Corynebacterium mastitidis]
MSHDSIPDRADKADGDDLDVPTFTPSAATPASKPTPTDPYKKVGRAAPQEIRPRDSQTERATAPQVPEASEASEASEAAEKQEPRKAEGDRSAPLLSDAPTQTLERPESTARPESAKNAAAEAAPAGAASAGGKAPEGQPGKKAAEKAANERPKEPEALAPAPEPADTVRIPADTVRIPADPAAPAAPGRAEESSAAYAGASAPVVEEQPEEPEHRRGTLDLGLLLLRCAVGFWLILHSMSVFFHLGDSQGLSGLEAQYSAYAEPRLLSIAVPSVGLAAGVFLVLGLMTPLFAAAAVAVTGFSALDALAHAHAGMDVFSWPDSLWLPVILGGGAAALQFTGPGLYSLDFSRGWARRPLGSAWLGAILGVLGAAAAWWFGAGINPLA